MLSRGWVWLTVKTSLQYHCLNRPRRFSRPLLIPYNYTATKCFICRIQNPRINEVTLRVPSRHFADQEKVFSMTPRNPGTLPRIRTLAAASTLSLALILLTALTASAAPADGAPRQGLLLSVCRVSYVIS